ncbi:MAG: hypothetical protein BWY99_00405 [Synergistetes bacterium ADurb.BinA166]|mgnify:CR=1 FL=1|nr:MAG: hypothetical protein BWY99_00405 [Synergistetes bacterium ADurb.BinA166]
MNTNNTEIAVSTVARRLISSDFRTQEETIRFVAVASRRFPEARLAGSPSPIPGYWAAFLVQGGVEAYGVVSHSADQDRLLETVRLFAAGYCAGHLDGYQAALPPARRI